MCDFTHKLLSLLETDLNLALGCKAIVLGVKAVCVFVCRVAGKKTIPIGMCNNCSYICGNSVRVYLFVLIIELDLQKNWGGTVLLRVFVSKSVDCKNQAEIDDCRLLKLPRM